MTTKLTLFLVLIIHTFQAQTPSDDNPNFFITENGVTCNCDNANFGDTGTFTINGQTVTYTKRTRADLDALFLADVNNPLLKFSCTSGITDMDSLFLSDTSQGDGFRQDISSWDVSNVTTMASMFRGTSSFNQPLNSWDVSNVTDMSSMFSGTPFNQPLNNWDVSSVINMSRMFQTTRVFNQDISSWDVSNVTDMSSMFSGSPFNQPLNNWEVSSVTNMFQMFAGNDFFNQPLNNWDVSSVTNMSQMFDSQSFNQPIGNWDVSSVIDMTMMFWSALVFNQDISSWCVEQIPTEPILFSPNSPLQNDFKPNWGATCSLSDKGFNVLALSVYPNPVTNGVLQINGLDADNTINVKIVSILGKIVISKNYQDVTRPLTLNVQDLNAGVYFITLSKGNAMHTSKIIIQ